MSATAEQFAAIREDRDYLCPEYLKGVARKARGMLATAMLGSALLTHHKDKAGIVFRAVDLEPPPAPPQQPLMAVTRTRNGLAIAKVVPIPTPANIEAVTEKYPTAALVFQEVGDFYKITMAKLRGDSRVPEVCHARHVAVYLATELSLRSARQIGVLLGGRDHSTISNSRKVIRKLLESGDERFKDELDIIRLRIREAMANGAA